jgi:hypothetical protein
VKHRLVAQLVPLVGKGAAHAGVRLPEVRNCGRFPGNHRANPPVTQIVDSVELRALCVRRITNSDFHRMLEDAARRGVMAQHSVTNNLLPAEFVRQAMTMGRVGFGLLYSDVYLLLVRLTEEPGELVEGLMASTGAEPSDVRRATLDFHTDKSTDVSGLFRLDRGVPKLDETSTRAWKALLAESPYFALPIRKRLGADAMSVDRISVGRARNKDIVLRHGSVSKFHGWFQMAEAHGLCFMDVGSKNGTRLNGKPIERRALVPLHPGDRLQVGRIESTVCTADVLWTALHRTPSRSVRPR